MALATHSPETDLLIPLPDEGERWDHHTIHTHYFGFCVPEAALGAFIYIRYQPTFPLCQGGVHIFRGTANLAALDGAFLDYEMTMPYPDGVDGVFTTTNGLRISFPEPGRVAHISYCSRDESTHFQLVQTAVTPLLARGHVVPGEEDHHNDPGAKPGGTEQIMHVTGQLTIRGEVFAVDCYAPRDRSWRQVRVENQGGGQPVPPVCWSPMYFGDDLAFNQVSFEAPDTDPAWAGMYTLPQIDHCTTRLGWPPTERCSKWFGCTAKLLNDTPSHMSRLAKRSRLRTRPAGPIASRGLRSRLRRSLPGPTSRSGTPSIDGKTSRAGSVTVRVRRAGPISSSGR